MNLKRSCYIIFLSLIFVSAGAWTTSCDSLLKKIKPQEKSSLFLFTAGYRMPINNNAIINSGHGLYFEGGINPGHLISKKIIIGFYAGWAFMDRLWSTSFRKDFVKDYSSSIDKESKLSTLDSTVVSASANLFSTLNGRSITLPGCQMNSFHNYSLYYGIMIKLPINYAPALKLYTGTTRSHFQGEGNIVTENSDFNIFELRRMMYGCEVILFRGIQSKSKDQAQKYPTYKNTGVLSIYYESCDFYKSTLYFYDGNQKTTIPLNKFASHSFLKKYRNDVSWGFKLAFSIM